MGHSRDMEPGATVDTAGLKQGPSEVPAQGRGPEQALPLPLLLFDGECGLCARSVRFILDRDRKKRLRFAPLQSELGRGIVASQGLDPNDLTTLVLVEEGARVSLRSTAVLRACGDLRMPWRLAKGFLIVPRFLRDGVYRWVAKHRLRWFGTADSCRLPTPEESSRFVL